jgi:hypothetical protein
VPFPTCNPTGAPLPDPIAIVRDYAGLLAVIRARRAALDVSLETVDEVSGFCSRYCSKLLTDPPMKRMGIMSLGAMLGTLGLALAVIEDPEALARVRDRLIKKRIHHKAQVSR